MFDFQTQTKAWQNITIYLKKPNYNTIIVAKAPILSTKEIKFVQVLHFFKYKIHANKRKPFLCNTLKLTMWFLILSLECL